MGEFPSGQRGQTVNLLLIASVVRIHLPPPAKDPPAKLVGLLLVGKDSWIRTHSNPTCRWHVGKTSANAGFLLTAFHRKAGNRIHLPRTAPPASLVGLLLVGKMRMDSNPLKSNMPVACWPDCQNSLAEFAASAAKRIRIIFCRGVYLAENTSQAASVEFVRLWRTNYARSRLQKLAEKPEGVFRQALQHAGGMLAKPVQTLVFGYISHRKIWQSCIRQTGKQAYLSVAEVFVPLNSYPVLFF